MDNAAKTIGRLRAHTLLERAAARPAGDSRALPAGANLQADSPPPGDLAPTASAAQGGPSSESAADTPSPRQELRQVRERLGMSQRELAAALGLTQARISLMERGTARVAPELLAAVRALASPTRNEAEEAAPHDVARPVDPPALPPEDPPAAERELSLTDADLDELAGVDASEDDGADDAHTDGADL